MNLSIQKDIRQEMDQACPQTFICYGYRWHTDLTYCAIGFPLSNNIAIPVLTKNTQRSKHTKINNVLLSNQYLSHIAVWLPILLRDS